MGEEATSERKEDSEGPEHILWGEEIGKGFHHAGCPFSLWGWRGPIVIGYLLVD